MAAGGWRRRHLAAIGGRRGAGRSQIAALPRSPTPCRARKRGLGAGRQGGCCGLAVHGARVRDCGRPHTSQQACTGKAPPGCGGTSKLDTAMKRPGYLPARRGPSQCRNRPSARTVNVSGQRQGPFGWGRAQGCALQPVGSLCFCDVDGFAVKVVCAGAGRWLRRLARIAIHRGATLSSPPIPRERRRPCMAWATWATCSTPAAPLPSSFACACCARLLSHAGLGGQPRPVLGPRRLRAQTTRAGAARPAAARWRRAAAPPQTPPCTAP